MSAKKNRGRRWLPILLLLGLLLVLQFRGEPVHAAPLQTTSVSVGMSNPTCVQVRAASGTCTILFNGVSAFGSDQTFSRLEVLVNGKLRIHIAGFFESSAYLIPSMAPGGLAVPCGRSGTGGRPDYGAAYSVSANAYMVDGTSASNSMTVYCPAYDGTLYLPTIRR